MNTINRLISLVAVIMSVSQSFGQMVILSGPEKGSYNRFAGDIVSVLGEKSGIQLLNRTTGGSPYNFKELSDPYSGSKIGLIQSDYFNYMMAKDRLNNTNKSGSLKVIMQLAREEIHFVAKKSSGLKTLQDLDKKKVATGNEDQGSFVTGNLIRERSKVNWNTYYVGYDQLIKDLVSGNIDAFLLVGSAPVNLLEIDPQVMTDGGTLLELNDFNGWAKNYENDTIYRNEYKWLDKDVPTFAVRTLLVVNESKLTDAEKKTVASIKSGIIQNLETLKKQGHPKWKDVIIPDEDALPTQNTVVQKNPEPSVSATKDDIIYRVQIYSRNYQKNDDKVTLNGKAYDTYVYSYSGAYRYTIGEFPTLAAALELQKVARESGYPQAFVAAFKNNIRSTDPELFK